uniref:Xylulose kinase-1 n=1 Tax=Tanacetum cinerariifolium TaxID=118510 RepID=A0A6L2L4D3_TANCI|nr:xylulose kinase-1 [Tanacetum cinerariifolium]
MLLFQETTGGSRLMLLGKVDTAAEAMQMEHYLSHTDYPIWQVIQNDNGPVSVTTDTNGMIKVLTPKTSEEVAAKEKERKARNTLLVALPEDHLAKLHKMADAKEMREAMKSKFGGNDESKKMQKYFAPQLDYDDLEQINDDDMEEIDLKWQLVLIRPKWNALIAIKCVILLKTTELKGIKAAKEKMLAIQVLTMKVKSCSKTCEESYARLKKLYDEQRDKLGDASVEITAYTLALKKEALKEKEDLKTKFKNWQNSSKNLSRLLNTQMSVNDKFGLGYGDYKYGSILSFENEVLQSVFMNKDSDLENTSVNDRYAEGMHAVPPPMIGNYMPSRHDIEINYSKFTYGPKQTSVDESDSKTSEYASYDSNSSVDTTTSTPELVETAPKVVCEPKVWADAPIIEEYESDSDDDSVSNVQEDIEKPSFAFTDSVKHVKTSRENVQETGTPNHIPKVKKKDRNGPTRKGLVYAFTRKACFVCGSFSHLIRDCNFHEKKMTKQAELTKSKNKVTGQRENRPVWNNVQRVNHQNKFVPSVLTKTGKFPVNAV